MGALLVIVIIFVAIGLFVWQIAGSSNKLQDWAANNGYTLIHVERRLMRRGPYFITTGKGQEVFFVSLRDREGTERTAYVRIGGFFMGQLSDNVDVSWES